MTMMVIMMTMLHICIFYDDAHDDDHDDANEDDYDDDDDEL